MITHQTVQSVFRESAHPAELVALLKRLREIDDRLEDSADPDAFYVGLVDQLREETKARYGAFGVFNSQGGIDRFIVRGMEGSVAANLPPPKGLGLLRGFYQQKHVVRVDEISSHPDHCGFPPNHPPMRSLLGSPLEVDGIVRGVIYLADKNGGDPFDEWDEAMLFICAKEAAHLIQHRELLDEMRHRNVILELKNQELEKANQSIQETQQQLLQSEKLACIGQLAAGIAHEINNPVGYIGSNIGSLRRHLQDLLELIDAYAVLEERATPTLAFAKDLAAIKQRIDVPYLRQDVADLMRECEEGVTRVRRIVQDLKDFSHVDQGMPEWTDLHRGIDSTLNVVWNELKYKAEVRKEYGELPLVQCLPGQINQVWMNLLVNAAHAIVDQGVITVRTRRLDENRVCVEVADTGCGIKPEHLAKIFDPFFTTKPVGKGTGLGLSVSFGIVQKHAGVIEVESRVSEGTTFRVVLPVCNSAAVDEQRKEQP